jgi:phosphatidylglycerophosphate synthase
VTTTREALRALGSAQKPSRGTAAYSRWVNRPLGRLVAATLHPLGVTPNQATVLSAALAGAGLLVLALVPPTVLTGVLVAVLLAAGYVLDSVDGQLARLRGSGSKAGEWLDHTVDCVKTASLHLAVLVSWHRFTDPGDGWLLLPLGFEVVAVVTYFGLILMPTLRPAPATAASTPATREHPLRPFLLLPTDYGFQCWLFVLLGWPALFRWAYAALLVCCAGALLLALRKWWRELRELDARSA